RAMVSPARYGNLNDIVFSCPKIRVGLECRGVCLAGADTHRAFQIEDEDLAVADLAGLGGRSDGFDDFFDLIGSDCDLDLELRQEAHGIFGAAIDFGVPLLTPISLDLSDG